MIVYRTFEMKGTINNDNNKVTELVALLHNLPHAILYESLNNEILFINQNFCDLFNIPFSPESMVGVNCSNAAEQSSVFFLHPQKFIDGILAIYQNQTPVINEELEMSDGRSIFRDYKPIISETGFSGHLWIYKYSDELRSIIKELVSQKNFYEELINNIPADIALFDNDHKYLFLNQVAISNESNRHWLIGKDDFDYCIKNKKDPQLALDRRTKFLKSLQTGNTVEFEEVNLKPDGGKVYNLRRFYPIKQNGGSIKNVVGYGINVTNLRIREENLKVQEESIRKLLDSIDQMVVALNEEGEIVFTNAKWRQLIEQNRDESIDKKIENYVKRGLNALRACISSYFKLGSNNYPNSKVIITTNQGINRYFSFYLSDFQSSGDTKKRVAIYFNDITEQLFAENKLRKIAFKEKKLSLMKSNFISLVSHELRTPLSVIHSSAELIELSASRQTLANENYTKKFTDRIIRQVDKMTNLMSEFLFLNKVESGNISYNPTEIKIWELLLNLKQEFFNPWRDGRHLQMSVKGKQANVVGDEVMISFIVSNLVNNAFKYSLSKADPHLRLYYFKSHWQILIVDTGIGIPANQINHVFKTFSRGSNVGNIEGAGFGLTIVKIFVKIKKGSMHIKSTEGRGTSVLLQFPY
jgi:PAS domain S-box-containing protein